MEQQRTKGGREEWKYKWEQDWNRKGDRMENRGNIRGLRKRKRKYERRQESSVGLERAETRGRVRTASFNPPAGVLPVGIPT